MAVSENDFHEIQGDSYRGSRYANFTGGGTTPQGNVSSALTENSANAVGSSKDPSADAPPTPVTPSQGLSQDALETPRISDMVIGAALPYAGNAIGQTAGAAIGAGASFGEGLSAGLSGLANNVSGGLIGTASNPTNIALSGMKGAYGPATSGAVNSASAASNASSFGSGANIGGAVGSGFATAAATLLTGGSVKDAVKSGAGTAVGTAIGTSIGGPIGGFIGGFIGGSIFCFAAGTPIMMENGTIKAVEELRLGDTVLAGGAVVAHGQAFADEVYEYKNTVLAANHAVFEDGEWKRVCDCDSAKRVPQSATEPHIVYPLITAEHLIVTPWFVSADVLEVPFEDHSMMNDEIIHYLNSLTERNEGLSEIAKGLEYAE